MQDNRNASGADSATQPDNTALARAFDAWDRHGSGNGGVWDWIEKGDVAQAAATAANLAHELATITGATIDLTPEEIVLFAQDARAKIASAGDELDHSYLHDTPLAEIEQAVDRLNVGLRILRSIERDATFPVDPDTIEVLERNRDVLTENVADGERHAAVLNERGVEAYAERYTARSLKVMTAADLLEDVTSTREQLVRNRGELATYTGFLNRCEGDES
jgi:hypothetical protein